jgi:transcriptional activator SPT7
MAPEVCRAAFQRSIGEIFYHAGFEDFNPSALETCTDIMGDYFQRLVKTFAGYFFSPKAASATPSATDEENGVFIPRYTMEEAILHTLHENSIDLESLESYVREDVERLAQKLGVMHERMKAHLADLLVSIARQIHSFHTTDKPASCSRSFRRC